MMALDLEQRFQQPADWRWGSFTSVQGRKLRYGMATPQNAVPLAHIVILPGRTEFAEKYFETANDLLAKNFSVWIFEWAGQGLSERFLSTYPQRNHSGPFVNHVNDLSDFITQYVMPAAGAVPLFLLAQSMGAHIGLRFMCEPKLQRVFSGAALCAPMLGMTAVRNIPPFLREPVSLFFSLLAAKSYAFGQADWSEAERLSTPARFSSDMTRVNLHDLWMHHNEALRVGGVTFGWLHHALKSCAFLAHAQNLRHVNTPCLIAIAGKDKIVDNAAIRHAAGLLPHAQLLELPDAAHEILMESDEIRSVFTQRFFSFIKETGSGSV